MFSKIPKKILHMASKGEVQDFNFANLLGQSGRVSFVVLWVGCWEGLISISQIGGNIFINISLESFTCMGSGLEDIISAVSE